MQCLLLCPAADIFIKIVTSLNSHQKKKLESKRKFHFSTSQVRYSVPFEIILADDQCILEDLRANSRGKFLVAYGY